MSTIDYIIYIARIPKLEYLWQARWAYSSVIVGFTNMSSLATLAKDRAISNSSTTFEFLRRENEYSLIYFMLSAHGLEQKKSGADHLS